MLVEMSQINHQKSAMKVSAGSGSSGWLWLSNDVKLDCREICTMVLNENNFGLNIEAENNHIGIVLKSQILE